MKLRLIKYLPLFLALIFGSASIHAQINTEQVIRVGQNALYFEDYILSIQYFNQAIAAKPYQAKPYLLRSIAKLNLEDFAGAEADAQKATELHPYLTDAWEVLGVARQNLGKFSSAVESYNEALKLMPRNRQLMFNKALALERLKRYPEADSTYAELLRYNRNFENGYLGRARLKLLEQDTVSAIADIDKALSLNKNAVNAYIMRADIAINSGSKSPAATERSYKTALEDMDMAIKLEPKIAGLYINRAFLRYNRDDYFGAMADYDYAIQLEPHNMMARFNRGILLAEVNANDRALEDFNAVLNYDPDDIRALFNRSLILQRKGEFKNALKDIDRVIAKFPDFPGGYGIRSDIYREMGDMRNAEKDYNKAFSMARKAKGRAPEKEEDRNDDSGDIQELPKELAAKRFASLLTTDDNAEIKNEYNNPAIRGRVQDRNLAIETEPMILLSYYSNTDEVRGETYYMKEIDDINSTRMLPMTINVTNRIPAMDEDFARKHFSSIEYYNSYLSTHTPRAIDYIGRAMDFLTIRDYDNALKDADRALQLAPGNGAALFLRFTALYGIALNSRHPSEDPAGEDHQTQSAETRRILQSKALDDAREALDDVLKVSQANAVAWFDKGNLLLEAGDLTSALAAYTKAIELKPDMGEAYFNRGYVYLKIGNQTSGLADLSKAGEKGIASAYNLIKRISN